MVSDELGERHISLDVTTAGSGGHEQQRSRHRTAVT